jgi:sporulation protein YlmC with PRC-barrel domain
MRKLQLLAFYALLTPAITLGPGGLLAAQPSSETTDLGEQSMGHDAEPGKHGSQQDQNATKSRYNTAQTDQKPGDQSGTQNSIYMDSPPANGMVASALIGTDLKSSDGESAGRISDLIIDQNGKVEAVLVNTGGLLAMGEKRVAIDWKAIKRSASPDDQDLRVDMTRDDLQSAPGYEALGEQRPNAPSDLRLE